MDPWDMEGRPVGSEPRRASKRQDGADMPLRMTFRSHVALKLRASHVCSTCLLNVILRGIYLHCFDFCWQAWVLSPFFRRSWWHQNQISPPTTHAPSPSEVPEAQNPLHKPPNRKTCRTAHGKLRTCTAV